MNRPKRPRDPAQLAKLMVDMATMDDEELKQREVERAAMDAAAKAKRQKPGKRGDFSKT